MLALGGRFYFHHKEDFIVPAGRPTLYTDELGKAICEHVASGGSVASFCRDHPPLGVVTIWRWTAIHERFRKEYELAQEQRPIAHLEMLQKISEEPFLGETVTTVVNNAGTEVRTVVADNVARARLITDNLRWAMSKTCPKKFGDRAQDAPDAGAVAQTIVIKIEGGHRRELPDTPDMDEPDGE